jgi:hypothetical protein
LTTNLSNGLIGLSLLSGTNLSSLGASQPMESAAVRAARALFTTPATIAPWQQPPSSTPDSAMVGVVKGMKTIIDKANADESAGSADVESSFIAYKALDRLRILADAASQSGLSDASRASLQTAFSKGLSDLEGFLAVAPGSLVNLAFGKPGTTVKTIALAPIQDIGAGGGKGVVADHTAPLPGITGREVLTINLASGSRKDSVQVDLSTLPQPPSLDDITKAFNTAIAAIPATDANGNPVLDGDGNPRPRYGVTFGISKADGKYGLTMKSDGTQVSIDQADAGDALMVVGSQTQFGSPTGARVYRYGDPLNGLIRQSLGTVVAVDGKAAAGVKKGETAPKIPANLTARASVTAADGFTYVMGTTNGDMGTHVSDGGDDLFLVKLDSEGNVVWQQTLGAAGEAQGAAISLTPDGDVVVTGSVTGPFAGNLGSNSDMLVARFSAAGEKRFATSIPSSGDDLATAVAVAPDGSIYLGGKAPGAGGSGAYIAHMDASGRMIQQRTIDGAGSDGVTAFAVDSAGNLLALTRENGEAKLHSLDGKDLTRDLGTVSLGAADARALAVGPDGSIVVVGAASSALPDNPGFPAGNGREGFVTRINADLSGARTTYVGGSGDDQIDSVAFMNGDIYVGGRTTSDLDGPRRGILDGFVGRIDGGTGAVASVSQFGGSGAVTDPVQVTAAKGGSNILGALGLQRGGMNAEVSTSLGSQVGLNEGDSFSFQIDGGAVKKISIGKDETLTSLQQKIRAAGGRNITVTTPRNDDGKVQLMIAVAPGHTLGLMAGPDGKDALAKLGMDPARLHADAPKGARDPAVKPGGSFGLALDTGMSIGTKAGAKAAQDAIKAAISMTQTAYRSLYWDDGKADQVNGHFGAGTARQQAQLASYQAALERLSGGAGNGFSIL